MLLLPLNCICCAFLPCGVVQPDDFLQRAEILQLIGEVKAEVNQSAAQASQALSSGLETTKQMLRSEMQHQFAAINQSLARLVRKLRSFKFAWLQ